jgi:hypothetical protein
MTDPHVSWLYGQIYDRFRAAALMQQGFRRWREEPGDDGQVYIRADNPPRTDDPDTLVALAWDGRAGAHIAMNDPEAVMAVCRAELGIVDVHTEFYAIDATGVIRPYCSTCGPPWPCPTIRYLHAGYSTRPGWQPW